MNKTSYKISHLKDKEIIFFRNPKTKLKGYVVIHNTIENVPAIGGIRMFPYSNKKNALLDALKLAEAMTYKLIMARIPLQGGKAVIMGNPITDKTRGLLKSFGEFIESLNGKIYLGEDMGTNSKDLKIISSKTKYCSKEEISVSSATSYGIFKGMKACLKNIYGNESFKNKEIAIQGMGKVGYILANLIHKEKGILFISDKNNKIANKVAKKFKAKKIQPNKIHQIDCDIFSPCANSGIINNRTIKELKCKIIAGAANNQLSEKKYADQLFKKKILYVPDYIINAGGVMTYFKKNKEWIGEVIYNRVTKLIKESEIRKKPINIITNKIVEKNL